MSGRLAGKVAFVTAAGHGIGRASVLAMAREGAQVYATDIDAKSLEAYAGVPNVTPHALVVLDDAAVIRVIESLPPLDVLFNCAGFVHNGTILECSDGDWDVSFRLNVRAMYVTIKAALPRMLKHGGGSIINMASVASSVRGLPSRFAYGASKAALDALTIGLSREVAGEGIRVNGVRAGIIDTGIHERR